MFVCKCCGYHAHDEWYLIAHPCSSHSFCHTCQFASLNDDARRRRYLKNYVHNYCEFCDRHFQSPCALKGHMETHEKRTVRCPRCNRGFPSKSAMTKHVELGKCYGPLSHPDYVQHVRDWEADREIRICSQSPDVAMAIIMQATEGVEGLGMRVHTNTTYASKSLAVLPA